MRVLTIILIFVLLLPVPALAADTGAVEEALPPSARAILGDAKVEGAAGGGLWHKLGAWVLGALEGEAKTAARSAAVALAVTLLCSVGAALSPDGKAPGYILLGGAMAIMAVCAGDMRSFLAQARTALLELSDFSKALLPAIAAGAAAGGKAASAAAKYAASALFMDVLISVGIRLVLPMIYAYAAAGAAHAALPSGALGGPVKLMGWACSTLLTGLTTVFTLALTVTGVVSGSADKVAGSLAKSAISAALPVVGSILADAADTYLAGAALVRGAVGLFGLAAVAGVCAGPALTLGLHYLLYKLAACVAEPFAEGRLAGLLGVIGRAYGMALGLVGSAGAMLFISVVVGAEVMSP